MVVDHCGTLLYPEELGLRVIGRLTLPIIAFLLVEGYHKTRHLGRYMLRLLAFALVAQPIYRLVFPHGLNVFFDLLVGLCVVWASDRIRSYWLLGLMLVAVSAIGYYIVLDWWHLAVLMIYVFHVTRGHFGRTVWAISGLLLANYFLFAWVSDRTGDRNCALINAINLGCVLALPLIRFYNGSRGRDCRYLFYAFYPAHLLVLWAIRAHFY